MTYSAILQQFTFTSTVLFLFFAVVQLSLKKKLLLNFFLAGLFFAGGYIMFYYYIYSSGLILRLKPLFNTEISVGFVIGPLFYLYFCSATGIKTKNRLFLILHFIPFIVSLIFILILNNSSDISPQSSLEHNIHFPDYYYYGPPYFMMTHVADVSIGIYFIATFIRMLLSFRVKKTGPESRIIMIYVFLNTVSGLFLIISDFFQRPAFFTAGVICFSILPLYYMLFSFRYPELSLKVLKEARTFQYEKSIVKNLDLKLVLARLTELMEEEKIYRQEDLNLQSLSARLKISSHQLSSILNTRINKNFRTYINEYRVNEAKRLLKEKPEAGILEIYIAVGFNSKSSFYSAFHKETGCLPLDYRK